MKIAVEGCLHGELDRVYQAIAETEAKTGDKIDLLICCGDFQAVRNEEDMNTLSCPAKYRAMHDFWKYYSGQSVAPVLTIFIGGNHEASGHSQELFYGGWAAPNMYYLGAAGVVRFGGLRIAGLSGIYKDMDYSMGHYEIPPYDERSSMKSVYHVREFEVNELLQLTPDIDILLTHDWPNDITSYGNLHNLLRRKPDFEQDIQVGRLGSPAASQLLHTLQPRFHFAAHMHCKFPAVVPHNDQGKETRFLALDKCMKFRDFLQIVDISPSQTHTGPLVLEYDAEWLAVLRQNHSQFSVARQRVSAPPTVCDLSDQMKWVAQNIPTLAVPLNFEVTVRPYNPSEPQRTYSQTIVDPDKVPQRVAFLSLLQLEDPMKQLKKAPQPRQPSAYQRYYEMKDGPAQTTTQQTTGSTVHNEEEISLDDPPQVSAPAGAQGNPEEIDLDL